MPIQNNLLEPIGRFFDRPRVTALMYESTLQFQITFLFAPFYYGKTIAAAIFAKKYPCYRHSFSDGLLNANICKMIDGYAEKILIFDDFDRLNAKQQDDFINYLLEHRCHCIILSRATPPTRLKSSPLCNYIGQQPLHFTNDELLTYGKLHFERVTESQIKLVTELSRGWLPAFETGLIILQRGDTKNKDELIRQTYAEIWHIFDDRAMSVLTPIEREFLLAIGCFPTISIDMAELVSGIADCQSVFDSLQSKSSYFMDKGNGIYSVHIEMCRYLSNRRSAILSKEEQVRIYRSAGRYYRLKNQLSDALTCYEKAGDYATIVPILEEIAEQAPERSQLWELRRYFCSLPNEFTIQSPILCFARAVIGIMSFNPNDIEYWRNIINNKVNSMSGDYIQKNKAQTLMLYLSLVVPQDQAKLLENLIETTHIVEKYSLDLPKITLTTNRPSIISGTADLYSYIDNDELSLMAIADTVLLLCKDDNIGAVELVRAEILYQKDLLAQALIEEVSVLAQIERTGNASLLFVAIVTQITIMISSEQVRSIVTMLDNLERKLYELNATYLIPNYKATRVRFALYDCESYDIDYWLENEAPSESIDFCTFDRYCYFIKLRVYIVNGQFLPFLALEKRLRQLCEEYERTIDLIELDAITAVGYENMGQHNEALKSLEKALIVAERKDFVRIIGNIGKPIYGLLIAYSKGDIKVSETYLNKVIAVAKRIGLRFPNYLKSKSSDTPRLTSSEFDVLRLIAQDYTNIEICNYLNITTNTVKFHSKNIFTKLSVKNRGQAVKVARELGLL